MDLNQILNNIDFFFDTASKENIEELKRTFLINTADDISADDFFDAYNIEYSALKDTQDNVEFSSFNLTLNQINETVLSGDRDFCELPSSSHSVSVENFFGFHALSSENDWAKAS